MGKIIVFPSDDKRAWGAVERWVKEELYSYPDLAESVLLRIRPIFDSYMSGEISVSCSVDGRKEIEAVSEQFRGRLFGLFVEAAKLVVEIEKGRMPEIRRGV